MGDREKSPNFLAPCFIKKLIENMLSITKKALEEFDNQHDFERMCADIIHGLGNKDVVLIAPRGGSDDGKDITFTTSSGDKGLACIQQFPLLA